MIILVKGFGIFLGFIGGWYCIWLLRDCWHQASPRKKATKSDVLPSRYSVASRAECYSELAGAFVALLLCSVVVVAFGRDVYPVVSQALASPRDPIDRADCVQIETVEYSGALVIRSLRRDHPISGIDCAYLRISDQEVISLLQQAPKLWWLNLSGTSISGDTLREVGHFVTIEGLGLGVSTITNDDLASIEKLVALKILDLHGAQVSDDGLAHLEGLIHLQRLKLSDTRITDKGLEHLNSLTSLRDLHLENTLVTDAGVARLQQVLPHCTIYY